MAARTSWNKETPPCSRLDTLKISLPGYGLIAPAVTSDSKGQFENQLEKAIVSSLHPEGWGNAVPTCSGLVGPGLRQMNIDLVHRIPGGFGFIELKWKSGDPVLAATQALRYAATYMLYRLEPELMTRLSDNEMLRSTNLTFEVLAPHKYYTSSTISKRSNDLSMRN
jgi:hypothetical protein